MHRPFWFTALAAPAACGNGAPEAQPGPSAIGASLAAIAPQSTAKARSVGAQLPLEIATWLANKRAACRQEGGTFKGARDHYLTGDFNGDGKTDYILKEGAIDCPHPDGRPEGAMGGYGRAGPLNDFLVSGPAGYRMAGGFSSYLEQSQVQRRGRTDVVVIDGGWNGDGGLVTKVVWGWNGTGIDVIERFGEKGERVDKDGYPLAPTGTLQPGNAGILPIPAGCYAVNQTCGEAASSRDPNGGPAYIRLSATEWLEFDGGPEIVSIRPIGTDRYRLAMRFEDEEGTPSMYDTDITITGPASFTSEERRYRHCPTSTVPRQHR